MINEAWVAETVERMSRGRTLMIPSAVASFARGASERLRCDEG